jgi:hypothetical protein
LSLVRLVMELEVEWVAMMHDIDKMWIMPKYKGLGHYR